MTARVLLLGDQIGYSASPAIHHAAFAASGMDARYELHDVTAAKLPGAVAELRSASFLGANVTRPHKLDVLRLVDELGRDAVRAGAANTIVRHEGALVAHNTDVPALAAEIARLCPDGVGAAVILGAGGASRAAALVLSDGGAERVSVAARDDWHTLPDLLADADLLVNATPIGTASDDSPVAARLLRPELRVLDLVYRPSPTRLVREARAVGAHARGGAGMLLLQAAASFELWTGRAAPLDAMRRALLAELGPGADV